MPNLATAIDNVRTDLMTVDAQLHCLEMALTHGSDASACSTVAVHTRELVQELMSRLDQIVSDVEVDLLWLRSHASPQANLAWLAIQLRAFGQSAASPGDTRKGYIACRMGQRPRHPGAQSQPSH